jgi:transcriptional regulator with XRE-family HTH domain
MPEALAAKDLSAVPTSNQHGSSPSVSQRLRTLRAQKDVSKAEVAAAIGVQPRTYANWESGETDPSATYIVRLAKYHGVSADHVLGVTDSPTGLEPGQWIIDLDEVQDPTGAEFCAEIPRRHVLVNAKRMLEYQREIDKRLAAKNQREDGGE